MKKDRKLNKLIVFASILGIIAGSLALIVGAGVAILGFLKPEELLKIEDLTLFISQEGIVKLQTTLLDGVLKIEYLYLFLGIFVGVVGLLALIFAIVGLTYAKKRKVVRRRAVLFMFNLIPLAIAGSVATYLVLEFDFITDYIKYVGFWLDY